MSETCVNAPPPPISLSGEEAVDFDVAIVGLGPVGAVAANYCARQGLRTLVVERDAEPYLMPRAIHFDAETMRVFQSLGISDDVENIARELSGSTYLGADGKVIRQFIASDRKSVLGWASSYVFYQPQLERLLRDKLDSYETVTVRLESEYLDVNQDADHVELQVRDRNSNDEWSAKARFLLACDGARSAVRKSLSIRLDDLNFDEPWLVVDALVDGPMRWPKQYEIPDIVRGGSHSLMVCRPRRPTTVIPGPGRHRRWEFMLLPHEARVDSVEEREIRRLLSEWVDPEHATILRAAVYRFHGLIASRWRDNRVFLLGDAAHQTPPFFGQGMCHGIRDVSNLVWKLQLCLSGQCEPALLDTYEVERLPHVLTITGESIRAGSAVCIRDEVEAQQRDCEFREAEVARGERTIAMADVVPPLTTGLLGPRDNGNKPDLRGAQFLQPPVTDLSGASILLDDVLDYRPAVIGFELDPLANAHENVRRVWEELGGVSVTIVGHAHSFVPASMSTVVVDETGAFERWFRSAAATAAVVRPDRYVFATGDAHTCAAAISEFARQSGRIGAQTVDHRFDTNAVGG